MNKRSSFVPSDRKRAPKLFIAFSGSFLGFCDAIDLQSLSLSLSISSSQAVAIQADCCKVSLRSNKIVNKIGLSLEAMKTMLER